METSTSKLQMDKVLEELKSCVYEDAKDLRRIEIQDRAPFHWVRSFKEVRSYYRKWFDIPYYTFQKRELYGIQKDLLFFKYTRSENVPIPNDFYKIITESKISYESPTHERERTLKYYKKYGGGVHTLKWEYKKVKVSKGTYEDSWIYN